MDSISLINELSTTNKKFSSYSIIHNMVDLLDLFYIKFIQKEHTIFDLIK